MDTPASSTNEPAPLFRNSITHRTLDFWLLGGLSILLWVIMVIAEQLRTHSPPIENHFMQMAALFSILSIFCNHPHFMISYRFAYGRGSKFIFKHWFSLIFVPLFFVGIYSWAYHYFDRTISEEPIILRANDSLAKLGLSYRFGTLANFGTEVLSLSVWLMYLLTGAIHSAYSQAA